MDQAMASPFVATASDVKVALLESRTDRLESRFRDAEARENGRDDAIASLKEATVELRTTLKIASGLVILATPMLAAFGAWIVLRTLAPAQSTPAAAAAPAFHKSATVSANP